MKLTLSIFTAFLLIGCSDSGEHQASQQKAVKAETSVPTQIQPVAKEEAATAPSTPKEAVQASTEPVTPPKEAETPAAEVPKVEEPPAPEVAAAPDGKALYERCVACHGAKAEKIALGKSKIIATWDALRIASALKGYKDGTYGGAMKTLMEGQVKKYSDEDIEAVSEYIESF